MKYPTLSVNKPNKESKPLIFRISLCDHQDHPRLVGASFRFTPAHDEMMCFVSFFQNEINKGQKQHAPLIVSNQTPCRLAI